MATDTKKESAPSEDAPPVITTGDGGKRRLKPSYKQELKRLAVKVILLVLLVVLLVWGSIFIRNFSHRNVVFRIDGKNYSKTTITEMVNFAAKQNGLNKKQEAQNIYYLYKTQIAAQKAGIIPNADELKAATDSLKFPTPKTANEKAYVNLVAFNEALPQTYVRLQQGGYEGLYFIFDFSAKILPPSGGLKPINGYGNQALINQDKQYADQQAQAFYDRYKQNPLAADDLGQQLESLNKAGFVGGLSRFSSGPAMVTDLHSQIYYPGIYDYVSSQTKPGLSDIRIGRVETKLDPSPSDYTDGYYYFVDIKKAGKVIQNPYGKMKSEQQKLGAAYYGI